MTDCFYLTVLKSKKQTNFNSGKSKRKPMVSVKLCLPGLARSTGELGNLFVFR